MRATLFTRLGLSGSTLTEYSQAVSMDNANAVSVDVVVFALSGTGPTVTVSLQQSNDLENWSSLSALSGGTITSVGYSLAGTATGISTAYVRLRVVLSGTSPVAIVSAGINTSLQ